jgi:hypothetical protein
MKKYMLRYLIFWAPAFLAACFFNNTSPLSQALQWFFAFFMVLGWCVNTGMATYHHPRKMLSNLLLYLGVNLLLITFLYNINAGSVANRIIMRAIGIFSYTPLDIFVMRLLDYNIPQEVYVTFFLFLACLLSWLAAFIYRKLNPNPYRPRITK